MHQKNRRKQSVHATDSNAKRFPKRKTTADTWYLALLLSVAFVVNAHTLSFEYAYDDVCFTSKNTLIDTKGIAAIPQLFTHGKNYSFQGINYGSYRPLLPISFAIEKEFFGFNPFVSHLLNLILFLLLVVALFSLLRKMFSAYPPYISFLILLLYELHPIHTEVIANVKSRDEILAFLFVTLALLAGFKYIDTKKHNYLFLSGIYFLLSLLSKESPVCFVGIAPLTFYFFSTANKRVICLATVPLLISAAIYIGLRLLFLDPSPPISVLENALVAASGLSEKIGTIFWIQLKYILLLIFPHPLKSDYSFNEIKLISFFDFKSILSIIICAALCTYAFIQLNRKNIVSYCILFYFASMLLTSNLFVETGATMAERFLFAPSLAFCIGLTFFLLKLFKVNAQTANFKTVPSGLTIVFVSIAILYAAKTISRNEDWKNNYTLFSSAVALAPESWRTQNCMGSLYKEMALASGTESERNTNINESLKYYKRSIEIFPEWSVTQANLGEAFYISRQYDSAIIHLKHSILLDSASDIPFADLGSIYLNTNKYDLAIIKYKKALSKNPSNVLPAFYLGIAYFDYKDYDSSVFYFKKAASTNPDYYDHKAFEFISIVYKILNRADSADKYKKIANRHNPFFTP